MHAEAKIIGNSSAHFLAEYFAAALHVLSSTFDSSNYRVIQTTGLYLRVDNFATFNERKVYNNVKSFQILSRKSTCIELACHCI